MFIPLDAYHLLQVRLPTLFIGWVEPSIPNRQCDQSEGSHFYYRRGRQGQRECAREIRAKVSRGITDHRERVPIRRDMEPGTADSFLERERSEFSAHQAVDYRTVHDRELYETEELRRFRLNEGLQSRLIRLVTGPEARKRAELMWMG